MAYDFVRTSSQYLSIGNFPVISFPITISCWFNSNSTTTNQSLVVLENTAGTERYDLQLLGAVAGDFLGFGAATGGTTARANTTIAYTANTWNHACGIEINSASRIVYLNGGNAGTNTTAKTPLINLLKIGALNSSGTIGNFMSGLIAEVGIWNASLTPEEVASLSKGISCNKVRPESLLFYSPLIRNLQDLCEGLTITNNNAATVANHPRIYK